MKILIADDYEDTRMILQANLEAAGYQVASAENGREALAMAREDAPDIIISDILMPEMDGFDFCRQVKSDEALRGIPFIFYTASYIDEADRELGMAAGASRFIIKPMDSQEFLSNIRDVLLECEQQRLTVPLAPSKQADELELMHERALSRKLDEKVWELECERRAMKLSQVQLNAVNSELETSTALLHKIIESVPARLFWKDRDSRYLGCNDKFAQDAGFSAPEKLIGQTDEQMPWNNQAELYRADDRAVMESGTGKLNYEGAQTTSDGRTIWRSISKVPLYDSQQQTIGVLGMYYDITEKKVAEAEIHRLAYYDSLTKLPNRRLLQDRLKHAIAAAARSKQHGAMFFVDIDHFKALNDTRGHDVGDLLLIDVAQRLSEVVREQDTVARQGSDEFVVLVEELGATDSEAVARAEYLGEKLRAILNAPFNLNGYEYHCKTSIGVGLYDAHNTADELFKHADIALYQAKEAGRDTLRLFNPAMQEAMNQRSLMEAALQKAIRLNQLELYYQPQMDAERRMVGVEALLRWQHPQRGLVLPDEFIPLAEDTGLILPIGSWVLETACAQIGVWEQDLRTCELQVAVNVSARQFFQPDFVTQVKRTLAASGINPAHLKLELTESLLLVDVKDTREKMLALKQLGVHFSMDDFGTGYSSLTYLAQLPLDQLKIDKSFVRNLPNESKDKTIARAIITMGLGLDMTVIAEGVESESQREFLEAQGCHEFQGYLFSRPLTIENLEKFLQQS